MKAEDVMTRRVVACRADSDLSQAARLMWENDCGSIPVVDADDCLVGILTDRDACMGAYFQGRALRELPAASCMAREVASCQPSDSALDVVRLMAERRVRRIPVTDGQGHLVGMVGWSDLLGAAEKAGDKKRKQLEEALLAALVRISAHDRGAEITPPLPAEKGNGARASSRKRANKSA
jgi:CBS-domain-containing membrane protein